MSKTVGDRARQEADAYKARAWYRDLESMTFGLGEYRTASGARSRMRHEMREMRTQRVEQTIQQRVCPGWLTVDSIALLGCDATQQGRYGEVHSMLETLRRQTPDIFTWHDQDCGNEYSADEVEMAALGRFKSDRSWDDALEEQRAALEACALDVP